MPKQVFLNELSFGVPVDEQQGRKLLGKLFGLLRKIDSKANGIVIVSHEKLMQLQIGDCSFGAWARSDRDRIRRIKLLENRSPFSHDLERMMSEARSELEYKYDSQPACGLALADWHEGLAVSVDVDPWKKKCIALLRYLLSEASNGELVEELVHVRNASSDAHVDAHAEWFSLADDGPTTPDEMLRLRTRWYPNIRFAGEVKEQIRQLLAGSPHFYQIAKRLAALQRALEVWNNSGVLEWGIKVTPENEGRHDLCKFRDIDGEVRLFEWHARYTPGAGRIHFRIDQMRKGIVIAYIGTKLEK